MVKHATSFSGSGLRDWLWQRFTALYMLVYLLLALGYILLCLPLEYTDWQALIHQRVVRIATVMFLFSFIIHGWIGMWTVATDYCSCTRLRQAFYAVMILYFGGCLLWAIEVIWSIP